MAARIAPHVTLVHEVTDADLARSRLAAAARAPFDVALTRIARWRSGVGGVYVGVDDVDGGIAALRERLADLERPPWRRAPFRPHVTLVHPKYVSQAEADEAWAALAGDDLRATLVLDTVSLVALGSERWHTVGQYQRR